MQRNHRFINCLYFAPFDLSFSFSLLFIYFYIYLHLLSFHFSFFACFLLTCSPTYPSAMLNLQLSASFTSKYFSGYCLRTRAFSYMNRVQFLTSGSCTLIPYCHPIHQLFSIVTSCLNKILEALRKCNCYRHHVCLHFNDSL